MASKNFAGIELQLIKVKHYEGLSQETNAFNATLLVNGKPFADIENDGHGGSDYIRPIAPFKHVDVDDLNDRLKNSGLKEYGLCLNVELAVGKLLSMHLLQKQLKSEIARSVVFIEDGAVMTLRPKKVGAGRATPGSKAVWIAAKSREMAAKGVVVLNLLPIEKASDLFDKHCGPELSADEGQGDTPLPGM